MNEDELTARAHELNAAEHSAGGPSALLASLEAGVAKLKHQTMLVTLGLVMDLLLSVVLGVFAILAVHTANRVQHNTGLTSVNRVNAHQSCLADNVLLSNDRAVWEFFLGLPAPTDETEAQRAARSANLFVLKDKLDVTFKLRDCP